MSPIAFLDRANVVYNNTGTQTVGTAWTGSAASTKLNACDNDAELYTEVATGTGTIDINFTGLGDITHIIARVRYLDGAGTTHTMTVAARDYTGAGYSSALYTINDTKDFDYIVIELTNDQRANFKDGSGNGIIRFEHSGGTAAGHLFELDYCVFKFNASLNESIADPVPSRLISTRLLTSGNYTPTTGTAFCIMKGVAGGGGGGGATGTATNGALAGGGASGGEFEHAFPVIAAQTVTLAYGSAGGGGTANGAGAAGGNSTVAVPVTDVADAVTITAYGGLGGQGGGTAGTTFLVTQGGAPGAVGTNATMNQGGAYGNVGIRTSGTVGNSGSGASSFNGRGGASIAAAGNGTAASGYGAGGSGAMGTAATTARTGGAGTAGCFVIYEYS
jgi:hypothetical protein